MKLANDIYITVCFFLSQSCTSDRMNDDTFYTVCQHIKSQDVVNFVKAFKQFEHLTTDAFWRQRIRKDVIGSGVCFPEKRVPYMADKAVRMEQFAEMLEGYMAPAVTAPILRAERLHIFSVGSSNQIFYFILSEESHSITQS